MDLSAWQKNWDQLGKNDPLWVVLTDPSKAGGRWTPEEFFKTGRDEIRGILADIGNFNVTMVHRRALDFGCGVGRLSQALAEHFDEVHGVDISPSMIAHANQFNQFPGKCTYHINGANSLPMFPADYFDFVYTYITLQHIEPRFVKNYIREFLRVIKPGGVVAFQMLKPVFWRSLIPQFAVNAWRGLKHGREPFIGMFGMSERDILRVLESSGGKVIRLVTLPSGMSRFLSYRFFVTKATSQRD